MDQKLVCVGCKAPVPDAPANEDSNFKSSTGWRATRRVDERGRRYVEWRCPECWQAFKGTLPQR